MGPSKTPLLDFRFVLHELLETSAVMQSCGRDEFDPDTIDQVLLAAGQFAGHAGGQGHGQ